MAKENIAFLVNLRKNTAVGTDREGRYYPEAESKEALTTKGFAKHVSEHGGLVTRTGDLRVHAARAGIYREVPEGDDVAGTACEARRPGHVPSNCNFREERCGKHRRGPDDGREQHGGWCELRVHP